MSGLSLGDLLGRELTEVRRAIREGLYRGPTAGLCPERFQANLVVLPREWAFDFLLFCTRNPKPCPLVDVTDPGDPVPRRVAPTADLRTDLPRYLVWERGKRVAELSDVRDLWRDDLVSFLLGCSFSFEKELSRSGIPLRHVEEGKNVPMFRTNLPMEPSGPFEGTMVVSMRPIPAGLVSKAVLITSRYPKAHGEPLHIGCPESIGIEDLSRPDFGDPVSVREGEVPVFWACGVSPQVALERARVPFAITHAPGHMLICDALEADLRG